VLYIKTEEMADQKSDSGQLAKYAEDFQQIYKSEKEKRLKLESAHKQLQKYAEDLHETISKLEEANKKLQKQVEIEEREKLIERKLIQANKMSSLGTMAAGIAHEINNPISFLLGNTQILLDIWKQAEKLLLELKSRGENIILGGLNLDDILAHVPKMLQGNFEGSKRINQIISGLKSYSVIPDEDQLDVVDINQAVQFAIELLKRNISGSAADLKVDLDESIPKVQGITQQIEQVIINLIQNSLNAMVLKQGKIIMKTYYKKEENRVFLSIRDQGKGIDKAHLACVTEPFFTTSRDQGGTGLGLYISYSIMMKHKGTLDIDSVKGKGTTVTISIPVNRG